MEGLLPAFDMSVVLRPLSANKHTDTAKFVMLSHLHSPTHYPKITGLAGIEVCPGQASQERVLTSQYLPLCGKATPENCRFITVRADLWDACLLISA